MKLTIDLPDEAYDHVRSIVWQRVIGNAQDTLNDLLEKAMELGLDLEAPENAALADQLGVAMEDLGAMTYWPDRIRAAVFNAFLEIKHQESSPKPVFKSKEVEDK